VYQAYFLSKISIGLPRIDPCVYFVAVAYDIIAALRQLEETATSDVVRDKAAGALWFLENKYQQHHATESAKLGLYVLLLVRCLSSGMTMFATKPSYCVHLSVTSIVFIRR